jgi:hypothetical protein
LVTVSCTPKASLALPPTAKLSLPATAETSTKAPFEPLALIVVEKLKPYEKVNN